MRYSIYQDILKRLKEIKKILGLSDKEFKFLTKVKRVSQAQIRAAGRKHSAWRVLHNSALGPGKGGIRFHPDVSLDEVKSLALWMSLKNSLLGLPFGGAKGGVRINPKKASLKLLEEISRKFINKFYQVLGEDKDIPAPDVYTNSQIMSWMLDEYEKKTGRHEPGMITGKPIELGGCELRGDATSKGGFIIIKRLIKDFKLNKKKLNFAVQGFGNAGLNIARMLDYEGFKVLAVSDSQGGVYNKEGLNIKELIKLKESGESVVGSQNGKIISNSELLELPAKFLILAALENQITNKNAANVKAKYIIELANGPIDYQADKKLFAKNIIVIPDILANAGGVTVSYFEWAQNKAGNILEKEYLEKLLKEKMEGAWEKVYYEFKRSREKIDLRTAAYLVAVKRIIAAERLRGNL